MNNMNKELDTNQNVQIAEVRSDVKWIIKELAEMKASMVSKEEFSPIKKFYDRILAASFGALVLIGTLTIGVIVLVKNKLF